MQRAQRRATEGFTLIELMIVVAIIAIISAIAIPSLLNARISGNEASAVSSLRTLGTVSEQYRSRFGEYPGATNVGFGLADLSDVNLDPAPYIDAQLGGGSKSGYDFVYNGAVNTWDCTADPQDPTVGVRSFFIDNSGVIRVEPDFVNNGSATNASNALD